MKGRFIVLCGIDGSGKTTQERLLEEALLRRGRPVHKTLNPSKEYRMHPYVRAYIDHGEQRVSMNALALLAATDRLIQLETEIDPLLAAGTDVICNRYVYSSYAYFEARGADLSFVKAINAKVRTPDKCILLTLDPAVAIERIAFRDQGRVKYEERSATYLGLVQQALVRYFPQQGLVLDGSNDAGSLAERISKYVD